jgi:hypothetical protein
MAYETRYFRASSEENALADVKSALEAAGLDPYEVALVTDDDGNDAFNSAFVSVHPVGTWYKIRPTYEDQKEVDPGVEGDHCLINFRSDNQQLLGVADSFPTTDPKTNPADVPDSEKGKNGLSRIDAPATPIRPIAT